MSFLDLNAASEIIKSEFSKRREWLAVPIRTGLGLNSREHWAARAKRTKKERDAVAHAWPWKWKRPFYFTFPLSITLVRIKPAGKLLDDDNLRGSLKAIRDQIAKELGIDDGSDAVKWGYGQEYGNWGIRADISW